MLLHGFTATPEEVRPLGDALAARGFACRAVRLAGHGTSVDDLARARIGDWTTDVGRAIDALAVGGARVAVAGLSLGALLAVRAAVSRHAQVAALALCATPLVLADRRQEWLRWAAWIPTVARRYAVIAKTRGRDIACAEARARSRAYPAMPLPAVLELLRLRASAWRALPAVTQPTLVLHGRLDHTAPVANVEVLRRRLHSRWVETHVFEQSAHVLTEDRERDAVAAYVGDFFERVFT